jgi:translation initiation factor IF-1
MVKNTMGGCNGKKVAHKHAVKSTKSGLRISQNKSEIYGIVKRLNGNTFDVTCIDEKERRCFIRGKFKGRGKRDNIIEIDKWVLIGLREFQQVPSQLVLVKGKKEMEMCDLLEVYSSSEKETLKRTHGIYMKESDLARSSTTVVAKSEEDSLQFVDTDTLRYQNIASQRVETIRLKTEQRKTNNNMVDQSAFYSDIESDDEGNDDEGNDDEDNDDEDNDDEDNDDEGNDDDDGNTGKDKNNVKNSESEESKEEEEEEEEESEEEEKKDNQKWNKNKRMCKEEEIDVDDI